MRINSLKIKGFQRTPFLEGGELDIDVTSDMLRLHGINGSGKSSTFKLLSPLPPDPKSFSSKGLHQISITHLGSEYLLTTDFANKPNFSFLKDEVELNDSGIVTAQRDLCIKHFGITPIVHDILVGSEKFTDMSLLSRKKLFNTITNLNIDGVLKGYNELKEEQKTLQLLLKTQVSNLKLEETKLIDDTSFKTKQEDILKHKSIIDSLLNMRGEILSYRDSSSSDTHANKLLEVKAMVDKITSIYYFHLTSNPRNTLPSSFNKLRGKLHYITARLDNVYARLEEKHKEYNLLKESDLHNKEALLYEVTKVENTIASKIKSLVIIKDPSKASTSLYNSFYRLEGNLLEVLAEMPPNDELDGIRPYTKSRYEYLLEEKSKLLDLIQEKSVILLSLEESIKSANSATGDITCPSCTHSWPLKEALRSSLCKEHEVDELKNELSIARTKLQTNTKNLEELVDYFTKYKEYMTLRKSAEEGLEDFWRLVDEGDLILADPLKVNMHYYSLARDVNTLTSLKEDYDTLDTLKTKLDSIRTIEASSLSTIENEIKQLSEESIQYRSDKLYVERKIKELESLEGVYNVLQGLNEKFIQHRDGIQSHVVTTASTCAVEGLDDIIREHRLILSDLESELLQINTVKATMDKYSKDIEDTNSKLKVLEAILTELCPKTGLIARCVSSFLNTIIHNVNNTIAKIWSYKMILVPIDVDNDTLNYRFKVQVNDDLVVEDISKVSSGMAEVINLSFKLVMYKLLGFERYPLYLDELSSNMDPSHTDGMLHLIQNLSTSDRFSQIFLITHKESFSVIKNLQVVELS